MIPIGIGVAVSAYLLYALGRHDLSALQEIVWSQHLVIGIGIALLTILVRDIAYIYRIWQLTGKQLSFGKCFQVIMLWEFGSSVTPASIGGITLALFILHKEKISFGKGAAIVLLCSYLDNIAFVALFSLLFFVLGMGMFDLSASCSYLADKPVVQVFRSLGHYVWIGFIVVAVMGGLLGFSIFVRPDLAKRGLYRIASWRILSRWQIQIQSLGEEIWLTSLEFKDRGLLDLMRLIIVTIISWSARYALASALLWTFNPSINQLLVFSRQYVHRVIVMIPATPGGSGIAEASFLGMNCEFMPASMALIIVLLWRLLNFYIYLAIGAIVLPSWLSRVRSSAG
jgi:glycosyltransferase 2 family protein